MNDKVVRITLDGSGMPVPDQDPIDVMRNEQKVKWCADFAFGIRIDGYDDVTDDTPGGSGCAFRVKTGFFPGTSYKYTIIANGKENDPTIIVKP